MSLFSGTGTTSVAALMVGRNAVDVDFQQNQLQAASGRVKRVMEFFQGKEKILSFKLNEASPNEKGAEEYGKQLQEMRQVIYVDENYMRSNSMI